MSSKAEKSLRKAMFDLDKRIKRIVDAGVHSTTDSATQLAEMGDFELHRLIDHKGSFKPYKDASGKERLSSQPGEPPASAPGNPLDLNIYHNTVTSPKANPAIAEFGVKGQIAQALEYGTEKMQPRPFVRPARETVKKHAAVIVATNFSNAMAKKAMSMGPPVTVVVEK
jgi:HK97 gp10 family phage protein